MVKPLRVLICGIPNVGKSTLINTLVRRKAAKTGDEAGITKTEQVISLASDVTLYDTPGMLWPRITVPQSGYALAASGSGAPHEEAHAAATLQPATLPSWLRATNSRRPPRWLPCPRMNCWP
jgi:hypothetical protein